MKLSKHQRGLIEYLLTEKLLLSEVRQSTFRVLSLRYGLVEKYLDFGDAVWQVRLTPKGREIAKQIAEESRLADETFWEKVQGIIEL